MSREYAGKGAFSDASFQSSTLTPEESVRKNLAVIEGVTVENTYKFHS